VIVRADNQTGRSSAGLAASVGPGGSFDLGQFWTGATVTAPDVTKIIFEPPQGGVSSPRYEVVYARATAGSAIATVVERQAEGSGLFDHPAESVWVCSATAVDFERANFTFPQNTPSAHWSITHNLGFDPVVAVLDSAGSLVEGDVTHLNGNVLTVDFAAAFSGVAYLVA
jgi:hypothetical protein